MKHLVQRIGLLLVAFSFLLMPVPVLAAAADMTCCDEMSMVAMPGMPHADVANMSHPSCTDGKNSGEQPDCCKQVAHAPAAVLLGWPAGATPAPSVPLFAVAVVLPESAPSGLRTPPPNA